MAKSYPPPPLAPMRCRPAAAQAKPAGRGVPPPLALVRGAGAPAQGKIISTARNAVPPPPLAPLRGAGVAVQAKALGRNTVPPPPLAPMRGRPAAAQVKPLSRAVPPPPLAPLCGAGRPAQAKAVAGNTVPPPPLTPMRGQPPAAQAKPLRQAVPPPPLAPLRGAGRPAQAKAIGGNTAPPLPLAPFPGQASRAQPRSGTVVPPSLAVQRKPRLAQVVWAVTHLVKVQDESLFGVGDNWQAGEVPDGELTGGQQLMVDDEDVFMSRRGANQEIAERRKADSTQELKHKWVRVLEVVGKNQIPKNGVYIRAETIELKKEEEKKAEPKKILVDVKEGTAENLFAKLGVVNEAWTTASLKRRRSIGQVKKKEEIEEYNETHQFDDDFDEISSGWNWDAFDEGPDVSGNMLIAAKRAPFPGVKKQWTIRAYYAGENEPIAYLILEERDDHDHGHHLYVRWLIGHPDKGGGGSAVIEEAKEIFKGQAVEKMFVDSAYSAVKWYQKMGFGITKKTTIVQGTGYSDATLQYPP